MIDGTEKPRPMIIVGVCGSAARERITNKLAEHGIDHRTEPDADGRYRIVCEGAAHEQARAIFTRERGRDM